MENLYLVDNHIMVRGRKCFTRHLSNVLFSYTYMMLPPHPPPNTKWLTFQQRLFVRATHVIKIIHYDDVIMSAMASQITSHTIVYSIVYLGADQRKHQSSASLAFVRGIHRWPVNSPHKGPVTRKMFPFDDVIIWCSSKRQCSIVVSHEEFLVALPLQETLPLLFEMHNL